MQTVLIQSVHFKAGKVSHAKVVKKQWAHMLVTFKILRLRGNSWIPYPYMDDFFRLYSLFSRPLTPDVAGERTLDIQLGKWVLYNNLTLRPPHQRDGSVGQNENTNNFLSDSAHSGIEANESGTCDPDS